MNKNSAKWSFVENDILDLPYMCRKLTYVRHNNHISFYTCLKMMKPKPKCT